MDRHLGSTLGRAVATAALLLAVHIVPASAQPIAISHAVFSTASGDVIVGPASFYDVPGETASGEQYDPAVYTAAVQLELRDRFGGIGFGKNYNPCYALAEYAGKRAILKFNDVGPLVPGRKFDLSRAAMEHFGGIEQGVLADLKITVLPSGHEYVPGPLPDEQSGDAPTDDGRTAPDDRRLDVVASSDPEDSLCDH